MRGGRETRRAGGMEGEKFFMQRLRKAGRGRKMSMTLEKAIELKAAAGRLMYSANKDIRDYNTLIDFIESVLRPVSREQVEKAEWIWSTGDVYICSSCGEKTHVDERMEAPIYNFCPFCMSPMTDEAVQMVMERLEALNEV